MSDRPLPRFPGGPDPAEPIPETPVDGVDLATCARICAALTAARGRRGEVLVRHRLDEVRWAHIETTWMLRIAAAMLKGELELARTYDAALAAAMAAQKPPPTGP